MRGKVKVGESGGKKIRKKRITQRRRVRRGIAE